MTNRIINKRISILLALVGWCCCTLTALAALPLEDGVYSISCVQANGYVGVGECHDMLPVICYVQDGQPKTADAYWVVTNTASGYTLRNEATGQLMVYTPERDDAYYKWMTLTDEEPDDESQYWYFSENDDGSVCVQSVAASNMYWNLRASQGLLGTYGGGSRSNNERFFFTKKGSEPDPGPGPGPGPDPQPEEPEVMTRFPDALHVFLKDGRMEAYPLEYITSRTEQDGKLLIETRMGQTYSYDLTDVDSVSEEAPTDFPNFESFKFNNKFNDQLFTDVEGVFDADTINLTVAAIGKRLTPSFKLPDDQILVYVDGQLQDSKVSRLRFDKDIRYVVTRPGFTMLLPEVPTEATGDTVYTMQPYGRLVRVHVGWLTDRAEVPRIDIYTDDGEAITSKSYYKDATISIDGHGIFPSMEETNVQIKGRGNSSWGWPKKPYRLKFEEKVKPLGMTKGKSWVLLSNYQSGSLMSNAIGMKAANLMKASGANHIVPVDLYLNGEYRGSYNLTEKVGFSNNSVDIEDESAAAMLELDSYFDEPEGQKFRSQPYNLPINIKEPDFSEGETSLTLETVENDFNSFMNTLYHAKDITRHVDLQQLARFLMVNELICNFELYHPKSTFCYRESFESDTSKYVFGPVWDLDWAFGYEGHGRYYQDNATSNYWMNMPFNEVRGFMQDLRFKYAPLSDLYKELWEKFMREDLKELLEYCQDYYDFAHVSFEQNRSVWGDRTNYEQQVEVAANWLETRANQIYQDILDDVKPDIDIPVEPINFENDKLYTITCKRGQLLLNEDHTGLDVGQIRTDAPEEDGLFAIINIDGRNYLYSPVNKKYLDCAGNGTWVSTLGSEINFDASQPDGPYVYMMSGLSNGRWLYFNNNSKKMVINNYSTPDEGNRWSIEPVADFNPTEALQLAEESYVHVTFDYVFDGQIIQTETHQVLPGSLTPEPSVEYSEFISIESDDVLPVLTQEDIHMEYRVIWNGPFQFTHSLQDAQWYNMTIRSNYYVGTSDDEPYYPTDWADEEMLQQPEYQWTFGGDPLHIKVYNRARGLEQVLTLDGPEADRINTVMREGDYSWTIRPHSDGFVLSPHGYPNICINQIGGANGPLQTWNSKDSPNDNGSTFRIYEAPEPLIMGDVNSDGKVSVTDAVYIVNYVLQKPASNFRMEAADLNGDGSITITDAVMIINMILQLDKPSQPEPQ